jgi:hypothetical protein
MGVIESMLCLNRRAEAAVLLEQWRHTFSPEALDSDVMASRARSLALALDRGWEDVSWGLGALEQES